ncbi:MAG TPA: lactate utilization protein [Rhodospirillaceae bacterium]|nr:lactate utilization protein [Magnetovibrio sp.]HBT43924.1 lactate utilization protein [Rhodospirillaceae bacterium]HCS71721.1 lactate utilization protein [Rhodospirillaceae bacterium]|tara:strand:- start:146 stop:853 length:708 start_codon:yes stop_codon:yes gene_type:complete
MSGREQILGDLRAALTQSNDGARRAAVAQRLMAKARHVIPARGQDSGPAATDRFQAEAERVQATVARVTSLDDLPGAIADYLAAQNLPANVRMTPDPRLRAAPWDKTAITISEGPAQGDDTAGVSHAFGAVAETGSLVFLSGPESPTTVNFLPPVHIAVLRASDISGCFEDIWSRLRADRQNAEGAGRFMPRTVNWITGPSRTADIELVLFLGIHGPKHLHIVIVDDGDDGGQTG